VSGTRKADVNKNNTLSLRKERRENREQVKEAEKNEKTRHKITSRHDKIRIGMVMWVV
jgi:hypothetical protein